MNQSERHNSLAAPPLLQLDGLSRTFDPTVGPVVDDFSLAIEPGEIFALLGPSGCGKTTVLRMIAGFERPDSGEIVLGGRQVAAPDRHLPPERRGVGIVFQEHALFPHLTVLQNVMVGLRKLPRHQREPRALEVLSLVGLVELAHRRPHELSGGQQQRVAVARSVAPFPRLILLDEAFSSLDARLRDTLRRDVLKVLREEGIAALLVTHDPVEAMSCADRVGVMQAGRLVQVGMAENLYMSPANAFIAEFLGETNLIPVEAVGCCGKTPLGLIPMDRNHEGPAMLSLRPNQLRLAEPVEGRPMLTVTDRGFRGEYVDLDVAYEGREYHLHVQHPCPYNVGDSVSLEIDVAGVVLPV